MVSGVHIFSYMYMFSSAQLVSLLVGTFNPFTFKVIINTYNPLGFPGSDGKESACNMRDLGLILGLGRFLGGGHGNPLQYSCLENPMDRGAWWVAVHGVTKNWT